MSSSSEDHAPDSEQLHQILQKFYSSNSDMIVRLKACAFFEETVNKTRCVAEDHSFTPSSPYSSCLVYSCYLMIKQFQSNYVKNLNSESLNLENESLLNFFVSSWNIFESGSIELDSACEPLYVHFSRHHINWTTSKIYVLALRFWHLHCGNFTGKVTGIVMRMINKKRRGEPIKTILVHETMRLLVQINAAIERDCYYGIKSHVLIDLLPGRKLPTEFIYHKNACSFYRLESVVMLSKYGASGYIKKVKNILVDEYRMCRSLYRMNQHIADQVQLSLLEIFIGNNKSVLIPDFMNAVTSSRTSVLKDFYSILSIAANPDLFVSFSEAFCDSVILDGKTIMEKRAEEFFMQPEIYMVTVLQIMRKYTALVRDIFDDNENFKKANGKALSSILNRSIASDKKTSKPCKYFAIYSDFFLKMPKADRAYSISELTCLFEYLENKYLFDETFYELLVKSLICATKINEEYEKDILLFVHTLWKGLHHFIIKERIKNIIKDIRTSKDLTYKFAVENPTQSADSNSELVVKVLRDENWPFAKPSFAGVLPRSLSVKIDSFSAFHKKIYPHKKLTFLHNLSQAEVSTHCFGKIYHFNLSLNQLTLLLQFNKAEGWPIKQLLEETKIDQKPFYHVIQNFIEAGILKYKENDDPNIKARVILNLDYENEKGYVRLSELKDGIQEAIDAPKKRHDYVISEENKCLSIEAAIVRIMKKELLLKHEELVTRTFEAMKTKFDFTSDMVSKSIDKLLKNDYIGRSQESEGHYVYIP